MEFGVGALPQREFPGRPYGGMPPGRPYGGMPLGRPYEGMPLGRPEVVLFTGRCVILLHGQPGSALELGCCCNHKLPTSIGN